SVFGRAGAVVAASGDYEGVVASALTGATAATRYVGGTASGAPASGTFAVGDYVVDQTGKMWVCTVAGSPGTWTQVGAGSGVSSFNTRTGAVSLSKSDVTGTGLIWSDVTAAEQLQAVAVKTSAYAAASGNFVP